MRAVIQRVKRASVKADGVDTGLIQKGLLVFLGVEEADSEEDISWLAGKIAKLRIFEDEAGKMNRSVVDIEGNVLLISQFTLYGNLKKGTRPSFNRAAAPDTAIPLYEDFKLELSRVLGKAIPCGVFGAEMEIDALNDGPVTLVLDTKQRDF